MSTVRQQLAEMAARYWSEYPGSAQFWDDLRADLEGRPEEPGGPARKCRHPTTTALRKALKSGRPVPDWAADYICARLDGTIKMPRGRPNNKWSPVGLSAGEVAKLCPGSLQFGAHRIKEQVIREMVVRWMRILRHPRYAREYQRQHDGRLPPKINVYQEAKERVAAKFGMSVDTVDSYVYPRRRRKAGSSTLPDASLQSS